MVFDTAQFGYGVGLVLCGWLAGMVIGAVLDIMKGLRS